MLYLLNIWEEEGMFLSGTPVQDTRYYRTRSLLGRWQPRAETRHEVMMEGLSWREPEGQWKEWKGPVWVGVCCWMIEVPLLSDGGFAGDTQTSPQPIFYDLQSFCACISPSFIPPLCSSGLWRRGWGAVIYSSVHLPVSCACVWGNDGFPQATISILERHYHLIGIPDHRLKTTNQYQSFIKEKTQLIPRPLLRSSCCIYEWKIIPISLCKIQMMAASCWDLVACNQRSAWHMSVCVFKVIL